MVLLRTTTLRHSGLTPAPGASFSPKMTPAGAPADHLVPPTHHDSPGQAASPMPEDPEQQDPDPDPRSLPGSCIPDLAAPPVPMGRFPLPWNSTIPVLHPDGTISRFCPTTPVFAVQATLADELGLDMTDMLRLVAVRTARTKAVSGRTKSRSRQNVDGNADVETWETTPPSAPEEAPDVPARSGSDEDTPPASSIGGEKVVEDVVANRASRSDMLCDFVPTVVGWRLEARVLSFGQILEEVYEQEQSAGRREQSAGCRAFAVRLLNDLKSGDLAAVLRTYFARWQLQQQERMLRVYPGVCDLHPGVCGQGDGDTGFVDKAIGMLAREAGVLGGLLRGTGGGGGNGTVGGSSGIWKCVVADRSGIWKCVVAVAERHEMDLALTFSVFLFEHNLTSTTGERASSRFRAVGPLACWCCQGFPSPTAGREPPQAREPRHVSHQIGYPFWSFPGRRQSMHIHGKQVGSLSVRASRIGTFIFSGRAGGARFQKSLIFDSGPAVQKIFLQWGCGASNPLFK